MAMQIEMPKYVDSLPQLMWWEADEVAAAIAIFGMGIMLHYAITSIFILIVVLKYIKKMKSDGLDGTAFHYICASGIIGLNKDFQDLLKKDLFL